MPIITGSLPVRPTVNILRTADDRLPAIFKPNYSTLSELSADYTLFTHLALFVFAGFGHDPIWDYIDTINPSCGISLITLNTTIIDFYMPADPTFLNSILAVDKASWPDLCHFMATNVMGIDRIAKRFCRTIMQKVPMVDHLSLKKLTTIETSPPMVDLYMIAVDGNDRAVSFIPAKNPLTDKIGVVYHKPDPDTIQLAEKLFNDNLDPLMVPDVRRATS